MDDRRSYRLYIVNGETADSTVVLSGRAAFYAFIKHFMSTHVPSHSKQKMVLQLPGIRKNCLIHRLSEFLFCSESGQLYVVFHYVVVWSLVFQKNI